MSKCHADLNNILVVGPNWIGDMVMTHPLYQLIKETRPQSNIDVLAPPWTAPLLSRMPEVNTVHLSPLRHGHIDIKQRCRIAARLKPQNYDQAIILTRSFKAAWVPFLAGISVRTGWLGEARWFLLNDIRPRTYRKMVQQFSALGCYKSVDLPRQLAHPRLRSGPADQQQTLSRYQLDPSKAPVLVLCPGAEYGPSKRWLPEYFAEVALHYHQKGWQVWLLGGKKDRAIADQIQAGCKRSALNLIGQTDLLAAVDLLSVAQVVLTNDTGLMHVAAAVDRPVVALYGASSPEFTPPLSDKSLILSLSLSCQPCFKRRCPLGHFNCMRHLLPEQVICAIDSVILKYAEHPSR